MPLLPPDVDLPPAHLDDLRLGHLLARHDAAPEAARAVLVGFPSDEGVRRNGGRPGAALGPQRLRHHLYRLTPDARQENAFVHLLGRTVDLGDVAPAASLEAHQEHLGDVLAPHLSRGAVAVVFGGGHETAYGHFLGYVGARRPAAILNWDAHPDVRPLKNRQGHSGSPFRQALLHPAGLCPHYTVAGLLPHSTARTHLDFIERSGGHYVWRDELDAARIEALYAARTMTTMVTFDLDAIDQAQAPGVSAPAVGGLPATLWLHAAYHAGRHPRVGSIDVVELNPRVDVDDRTARLAALTVWYFLKGLAERK
jgi:formiminoglutamase